MQGFDTRGAVPGERLGRYELVKRLGHGGMAEVWLANEHGPEGSKKQVALKRLLPEIQHSHKFVTGLLDEARLAAKIVHPNVVQIYDLGREGLVFYLAMEYLHGVSLLELQRRSRWKSGMVPAPLASLIILQLCQGLDFAHHLTGDDGQSLNIVHRDVSPHNVMVLYDGTVKLLDFGIAKARARITPDTAANVIKGKLTYMAPEQLTGAKVDCRTDVFACGVVLWELITGQCAPSVEPPVRPDLPLPRQLRPDIPTEIEALVLDAIATRPSERFQTAGEMSHAIEDALASLSMQVSSADLAAYVKELFGDPAVRLETVRRRIPNVPTVVDELPAEPLSGQQLETTPGKKITRPGQESKNRSPEEPADPTAPDVHPPQVADGAALAEPPTAPDLHLPEGEDFSADPPTAPHIPPHRADEDGEEFAPERLPPTSPMKRDRVWPRQEEPSERLHPTTRRKTTPPDDESAPQERLHPTTLRERLNSQETSELPEQSTVVKPRPDIAGLVPEASHEPRSSKTRRLAVVLGLTAAFIVLAVALWPGNEHRDGSRQVFGPSTTGAQTSHGSAKVLATALDSGVDSAAADTSTAETGSKEPMEIVPHPRTRPRSRPPASKKKPRSVARPTSNKPEPPPKKKPGKLGDRIVDF